MIKPTEWVCAQWTLKSAWASAQSDQSPLSAWRKLGSLATHWAHSQDSAQTGWMPRLIWVFAGRTLILLVLSCCCSYHKNPKYLDTPKICCNPPKILTRWLYQRVMHPKDAAEIANSVDPDLTAPLWSGSALFAQTFLSENLRFTDDYGRQTVETQIRTGLLISLYTVCLQEFLSEIKNEKSTPDTPKTGNGLSQLRIEESARHFWINVWLKHQSMWLSGLCCQLYKVIGLTHAGGKSSSSSFKLYLSIALIWLKYC